MANSVDPDQTAPIGVCADICEIPSNNPILVKIKIGNKKNSL